MNSRIRRIIAEELVRIMEGEVIRPDFGSAQRQPEPEPSVFEQALISISNVISEVIEAASDDLNDDEMSKLDALLDMVEDMQSEFANDVQDEDERAVGPASSAERDELRRFKDWMKLQDVD